MTHKKRPSSEKMYDYKNEKAESDLYRSKLHNKKVVKKVRKKVKRNSSR